jgi:homoaconitate hydratase
VGGKDVIITLCGLYNHDEALNAAVEFSGPGVVSLPMDARLSISNMSTEWGPIVGSFPVDEITIRYLRITCDRLLDQGIERFTEADLERWSTNPPQPDPGAEYAARIVLDLSQVTPHVSGPDTVQTIQSVAEIEKKHVAIHKA